MVLVESAAGPAAMNEFNMRDGELSEQIGRLEQQIEELGESLARCRKISLFSKAAMAAGGLFIVAMTFGAITFDPTVMVGSIAAVVGGTVLFGSNSRTEKDFAATMKAAEAHRTELIGRIDLRVVGGKANLN